MWLQSRKVKKKKRHTCDLFFLEVSNYCKRKNTFPQRQNSLVIAYKILYIHQLLLVTIYFKHLNLCRNVNPITRCFPLWLCKHVFPFLCSVFMSFILYIYSEGANIFRKRTLQGLSAVWEKLRGTLLSKPSWQKLARELGIAWVLWGLSR